MEKSLTVQKHFGNYSIIRDIPYYTTEVDKRVHLKYTMDLYLPRESDVNIASSPETKCTHYQTRYKPPIVVFAHGGGWRRGDKNSWQHFTSEDINLLVAFFYWLLGLYGNIGKSLARRGVPCAVMSYPLSKLRSLWLFSDLFTSYFCSMIFVGICFGIVTILFLVLHMSFSNDFLDCIGTWYLHIFGSNPFYLIILNAVASNLSILLVITFQFQKYHGLNLLRVSSLWIAIALTYPVSIQFGMTHCFAMLYLFLTSFILSQGIIGINLLMNKVSSPKDQLHALTMCIKKVQQIGETSGYFDSKSTFLMGHSSGGYLCAMTILDGFYLQKAGISPSSIKGVILISAVLCVERINFGLIKHLYLYPTFGTDPRQWQSLSPLNKLKSEANCVSNFLIVTAENDLYLEDESNLFMQELQKWNVYSKKVIIKGANHMSIIWFFDKCRDTLSYRLPDICVDFIKKTNRPVR